MDNKYDIDIVRLLTYVSDWNKDDILKDVDYSAEEARGTIEGYALAVYLMLKCLKNNDELYEDFVDEVSAPLPYLCGSVDIARSVTDNTFVTGMVYQSVREKSYNIPVNLSIKFCLDYLISTMELKGTELAKKINCLLVSIFGNTHKDKVCDESIIYYLEIINSCLSSNIYQNYYSILNLCGLFLENLYINGSNPDYTEFFSINLEYVFQEMLRTATRHVMLRLNNSDLTDIKGNWSMRRSECYMPKPNLRLDTLVRFTKKVKYPHLIIDSKTNLNIRNVHKDNYAQMHTYMCEYYGKEKNFPVGIIQYFVSSKVSKSEYIKYTNKTQGSNIDGFYLYTEVFVIEPSFNPKDYEDFLYDYLKGKIIEHKFSD